MTVKRKWGETFDDAFDRVVAEQERARATSSPPSSSWTRRIRDAVKRRKP